MKKANELEIIGEKQIVNTAEIPALVNSQTNKIKVLRKKVDLAIDKAKEAEKRAAEASEKGVKFGHKKDAILDLQKNAVDITDAQSALAEAQQLSFEYQELLGKITQGLFVLGVANMAANRSVVKSLRLQLEGATSETLDEMAQHEIQGVIDQLQAQQDIMMKQEELTKELKQTNDTLNLFGTAAIKVNQGLKTNCQKLNEHDEQIAARVAKDVEQDKVIKEQAEKDKEHDQLLEERAKKDKEHDRLLAERVAKDAEQDKVMREQAEKDKEHDRLLEERAEKDKEHDQVLAERVAKDAEQDKVIREQAEKDKEHDRLLEERAEKDKEHDRLLEERAEKDKEHDQLLAERVTKDVEQDGVLEEHAEILRKLQESNNELSEKIKELQVLKTDKKITFISYIISVIALVAAITQIFL